MSGKNGGDICCEKFFHLLKTNLWIEYKKESYNNDVGSN